MQRAGTADWTPVEREAVICLGDALRVQGYSRATLRLPDQSVIRVDQHSTLTLAEPDDGVGSLLKLLRGVIHVISRDPRSLRFSTPHVNAGLKGTEFDIRVDDAEQRTAVAVLEGQVEVTNAAGRIEVPSGFVATAHGGEMPAASAIVEPIDLMRWAGYFPAILDGALPDPAAEPPSSLANDPAWLASRAAARLQHGDLAAAEVDLAAATRKGAGDPIVLALGAIAALGHGDIAAARERAHAATTAAPGSAPALIALSYVQSADGDVAGALANVRSALASAPNNAIAWARRAELELGLGDSTASSASAQRAIELVPSLGYAHSVLGFIALRRFDVDGAIDAFDHASELDQGAPLPQLGLALALMQRGDLVAGREHLEVAVALDPSSSIVRSYMGKTYDAEYRAKLPASQLAAREALRSVRSDAVALRRAAEAQPQSARRSSRRPTQRELTGTTIVHRSSPGLRWTRTSRRVARARRTCCASSGSSSSRWCKVGRRHSAIRPTMPRIAYSRTSTRRSPATSSRA